MQEGQLRIKFLELKDKAEMAERENGALRLAGLDGWMDGWMDGVIDALTGGWIDDLASPCLDIACCMEWR